MSAFPSGLCFEASISRHTCHPSPGCVGVPAPMKNDLFCFFLMFVQVECVPSMHACLPFLPEHMARPALHQQVCPSAL